MASRDTSERLRAVKWLTEYLTGPKTNRRRYSAANVLNDLVIEEIPVVLVAQDTGWCPECDGWNERCGCARGEVFDGDDGGRA